jgi:LuxR family transcriptional regulator, maltose regulon positive regulatory protein
MPDEARRQVAIEAKHLRPRSDHVSLRADSLAAFAAAFDNRLTVVSAPAGYGKTATTAAALARCGRTASWYKLDILDHDPLAFLASMVRAVRRLHPGFGAALLLELEAGPVVDLPVEVLAARFCAECDRQLTDDIHLVLDDYHEAMDSAPMDSVLSYLLENCPGTLHFVVLTRYEPTLRLSKLHLAGEVCRLSRELLLFDMTQVTEVLTDRSGKRLDPGDAQRVLDLTEGWPASVVLAGMALAWFDVASLQDALADPRLRGDVFSYLAEQVFQRQTEEIQRFLLDTCCLEHVTVALGESLTGSGRAARHLSFLARNQVFTFETAETGTYRYHNLLSNFLRQRYIQDDGEHAFRALQKRTAVVLEEYGDFAGATELLLDANELELALGVVARGGEAELERRPSEQLRVWVERFSPCTAAGDAWALIVSAVLDVRDGRFAAALECLAKGCSTLRQVGDDRSLYQALSIREWAEFWSGDCTECMRTCAEALELATEDTQRLHTLLSLLSAAVDMKDWDRAAEASAQADCYLNHAKGEEAARAQGLKAHAAYFQGDMMTAHRLITGSKDHGDRAAQRAAVLNTRGMIETALADYTSAQCSLEAAAALAEDFGQDSTSYMIKDSRACLESAVGDFDGCVSTLERLGRSAADYPWLGAYTLCHLGTALRRSGMLELSVAPTEEASALNPIERDPYVALNATANLHMTQGLLGAASIGPLMRVSEKAAARGLRFVELKALLFSAVLFAENGDAESAIDMLERCLPEQLLLGHVNLIAQELGPRPELTGRILRRHRQNGLGPSLTKAISRYWGFAKSAPVLKGLGPRQVTTWIDQFSRDDQTGIRQQDSVPAPSAFCESHENAGEMRALTKRETEVLELMAADYSNDEIARSLFISLPTVKTHVNHILRKLGQKSRVGAILIYQRESAPSDGRRSRGENDLNPGR